MLALSSYYFEICVFRTLSYKRAKRTFSQLCYSNSTRGSKRKAAAVTEETAVKVSISILLLQRATHNFVSLGCSNAVGKQEIPSSKQVLGKCLASNSFNAFFRHVEKDSSLKLCMLRHVGRILKSEMKNLYFPQEHHYINTTRQRGNLVWDSLYRGGSCRQTGRLDLL